MKSIITILLLTILLIGCAETHPGEGYFTDETDLVGASLDASSVFTAISPAADIDIPDLNEVGTLYVTIGNASTTNRTVTVYGLNLTGSAVSEVITVNGSMVKNSTLNYTEVHRITLNQTYTGDTSVYIQQVNGSNVVVSRDLIVTISSGETDAYNSRAYDGSVYAVPLVTFNASDIYTARATEYTLYVSCDVITKGDNLSVTYFVSPDATNWFTGGTTIPGCNNTEQVTQLTDTGVQWLRLRVANGAALSNQELVKLVYR